MNKPKKVKKTKKEIPVPRVRISAQEELLAFLYKKKPIRKPKVKQIKLKRVKRTYTPNHWLLIVLLRYGSIDDFSRIRYRWCEIARMTGILPYTCQKIVKDFHLKGNRIEVKKKTGSNV